MENCNVTYPGWNPQKMIRRVTKTIDKYDCEGRYLGREVITEETEDVYVQDWNQPIQPIPDVWCGNTGTVNLNNSQTHNCVTSSALSIN